MFVCFLNSTETGAFSGALQLTSHGRILPWSPTCVHLHMRASKSTSGEPVKLQDDGFMLIPHMQSLRHPPKASLPGTDHQLKKISKRGAGWHSRIGDQRWVSAQLLISRLGDGAPVRLCAQRGVCLRHALSLALCPSTPI